MLGFRTILLLSLLTGGLAARGQSPAAVPYEAEALRYLLTTLVPRDHPTYRKLTFSGYVLPDPFTFRVFPPCFAPLDSVAHEATFRIRSEPTGKSVPLPPGHTLRMVKRLGRTVPWVGVCDAMEWRTRRVVPIYLSLQRHYSDCYFITLNLAGQVVSACRVQRTQ